ncbi:MAG: hypothetical protein ABI596_04415, partial [Pyrinomonadaceae bacterium]
ADDMVAFLYGEASATEADDFAGHMDLCASCRTEFAVFRTVRESVSEWRSEVLGVSWHPQTNDEPERLPAFVTARPPHKATALAALREFFAIAPMWLRGATAVASVLFCVLVTLFIARMVKTPERLYSEREVNAQVENRIGQLKKDQAPLASDPGAAAPIVPGGNSEEDIAPPSQVVKVKQTSRPRSRKFLSRAEREQLAADLGLKPANEEDDLSFPLDGGSN